MTVMFPFIIIAVWVVIIAAASIISSAMRKGSMNTISSDRHAVPREDDFTCETKYGHHHDYSERRYVVHEEPQQGYVVLNGIKRRIEDCKNL